MEEVGGGLWQWVLNLMTNGLVFFEELTGSYGLAIVLLTVAIRLVMLPLTWSQVQSTTKMQMIQPKLNELQKKYKNDQQRLNQEMMKIFQENKINPLAGCLPLLLQLPFLIAFFQVLRSYNYIGSAAFLWIPDLALPDPFKILPILAGLTTYLQMKMTTPQAAEGSQKTMLYAMPVMIGWFSMQYAAGLSIYWVVSNLFGIVQQMIMPKPALATGGDSARKKERG